VIGDNPGGPGQIELNILQEIVVSASVLEQFDNAEYGDHSEKREDDDTILKEQQWEHIKNDHDVTREEIRETIVNPDEVFAVEHKDRVVYMWERL